MEQNQRRSPRKQKKTVDVPILLAALFLLLSILIFVHVAIKVFSHDSGKPGDSTLSTGGTQQSGDPTPSGGNDDPTIPPVPSTTEPQTPHIVSTASIGVTGDVLMHGYVINAGKQGSSYEFSQMFQYVKPYYEKYDLMVANLETTLGGPSREYKGYPNFNCPDQIVDALKGAGVDLMLTANNHSYDTGFDGFTRTLDVIKDKGLLTLGTQSEEDATEYIVQDINGIKVGMICYTYETGGDNPNRNYLNGILLNAQATNMVTCFNYAKLDAFYAHLQTQLTAMEAEGAEATVVFIHWGDEYALSPNANQKKIAQKMCDLGVDVIVGGHPHVIEPFTTLTSDNGNTAYCIYSVGNALSNQNRITLQNETKNCMYTEDGMIFGVTFQKWNDGEVEVAEIEITPTWVDRYSANTYNGLDYRIYPLDTALETWNDFGVKTPSRLEESYNRTMSLVGEGLNECRAALGLDEVAVKLDP